MFRLMFALRGVCNVLEEIFEVHLVRTLQRTSFFKPTMATLFHDRTSLRDSNSRSV